MEKIKELMYEQIAWMFSHNGERNEDISKRLSAMIDEYCKADDDEEVFNKLGEVQEVWEDVVLTRYNFAINEAMYEALNS